ncbi:MAG TPA: AsmA-like C-terminal domain-containing protein, partial [Methylocella sp.]|nr:AsmA-like C-terminal domain-containing protein [Methylocella sp.]
GNQKLVFNGVNLAFERSSGSTRFDLSVDGPNGRWRALGSASGAPGLERSLTLSVSNLSADEVLLAAGTRTIGVDFDMPLSGDFDIRLGPDGMIAQAAGQVESGPGYFRFDDPDSEPTMVDKLGGGFHWNPARRIIVIDRLQMAAGETHFGGSGSLAPPGRAGDPWSIHLANTEPNAWGAERPGEKPILLDLTDLSARLYAAEKKFTIDKFSFSGPQCGLALAGTFDWFAGPHLRLGASISPMPIKNVTRLWPSFIAASVRSYLLSHASEGIVEKGTIQVNFDAADLRAIREEHAPADANALVEFTIKNASLGFLPGVPALHGIDGVGRVTGRTAIFTVSNAAIDFGKGHTLTVWGGGFRVADTDPKPIPAIVEAKAMGSVEAIGELLSHDALKPYASLPLDSSTLSGEVNGNLEIDMSLGSNTGPSDTRLKIDAIASNLTAERLIGNEKLEAATLVVNVDPTGMKASGQGTMFGAPVTVDIARLAGKPAEASIGMTIDDPMRARLGLGALPGVSGPVAAKFSSPIGTGEKPKAKVELDLNGATIDIPGISKPLGQPGKILFTVATNEASTSLDQIVVDAGPVQARGKMELGPGFSLIAASFPQLKLSSGDELKVDATGAGDTLKVVVRGTAMDARPFLKSVIFDPPKGGTTEPKIGEEHEPASRPKEIEFDVKTDVLNGHNNQTISGAELLFAKRGSEIKQFSLSGTFGADQISGNLIGGGPAPRLNLDCDNAGAFLSFLDLYAHMEHGRLSAGVLLEPDALIGVLVINNFVLRDEPALRRLVAEGTPQTDASGQVKRFDTNAVAFNKLQVRFQRDGSRLALSEGTMNGDAIGLTVDGAIDYVHDVVDMKGTFVPVYSLNNIFAKIPIVGPILGGRSEEGLIGLNYRISGLASAPTLNVNPLSAIAPGMFRQIFGVVDFDPQNPQR